MVLSQPNEQPLNVVPYPQEVTMISCNIPVLPGSITIKSNIESVILSISISRYQNLFFPFTKNIVGDDSNKIELSISIASDDETLQLGVDESYSLLIDQGTYQLKSNTIYGAMRGLETFKQMIVYDVVKNSYSLTCAEIMDFPTYQWRGFLVDNARHYLTKDMVLHIIDSLGYNKFNVMHWHLIDTVAFPVESKTYPKLTEAILGPHATISHDEIEIVVAYAKTYGIRVIPEFDVPGHSSSWGVGYPELLANCPGFPASSVPLDCSNPNTYTFLENFFSEIAPLFEDDYFHTGGDELVIDCWANDTSIQKWMKKMNYNTSDAFQYFEDQLDIIMTSINRKKIAWNDALQHGVKFNENTLVQTWTNINDLRVVLAAGYKTITSFFYYLDRQSPDGYYDIHYEWQDTWQDFYASDPRLNITSNAENILGGEATMFGEQVSSVNWDARVWPRAIGISERLWSSTEINNVTLALPRVGQFSCDMSRRGILSGPLFPDYCPLPEELSFSLKPVYQLSKDEVNLILKKKF
ncbi:hypothetical protein RB653_006407 [Dictyostelium firmibasis]|uniref:Beta-hexosaminidase n=1 Tax=Dictyostelium firmibasis TaxID=79012 RepID=A0AAN7UEG3_9MYCE